MPTLKFPACTVAVLPKVMDRPLSPFCTPMKFCATGPLNVTAPALEALVIWRNVPKPNGAVSDCAKV